MNGKNVGRMTRWAVLALAVLFGAACDAGTGLNGPTVAVQFGTPTGTTSYSVLGGALVSSIDVQGSNGTLTLDTVHVILNEFELEQVERVDDCDASGTGNPCREFEAPPSLLNLPLEGGSATAVSADIPEGEYDELEFEIEDLEDDEEDPVKAQQIEELRNAILDEFGVWPREASMRVVGSFTPTDGEAIPFVVYLEAEVEVELEFATPFVVTEDDVSRTITVELLPADWFLLGDGSVMDLSEHDYESTGSVPEFEVEIENGFKSVEHDDED